MKGKQILAGALALMMALSSCTKENGTEGSGGDSGQEVVEGLSTYASISISQSARPGTYAGGAEAEKKDGTINKATVFVVSADGIVRDKIDITTNATAAFQTTTGKKYLYALVNLPDKLLEDIKEGETKWEAVQTTMQALMTYEAFEILIGGANPDDPTTGFWMSNFYGVEGVQPVVVVEASEAEVNATDQTKKNNFTINVGRMVAKVKPQITVNTANCGGVLSNMQYRMRQYPKYIYLFQQYQADATAPGGFLDQVMTPYYFAIWQKSDKPLWTVDDPTKISQYDYFEDVKNTGTAEAPVYTPEFSTLAYTKANPAETPVPSYVTENTTKVGDGIKIRNKGTYLSIKTTFNLEKSAGNVFLTADGKKDATAYTAGTTFYRVAYYNTSGEIAYYCGGLYLDNTTKPTKVVGKTTGWNWGDKIEFWTATDTDKTEGEAKGAEDIADTEWRTGDTGAGYALVEYKDAVCYYGMWLFDQAMGDNLTKKYSVLRNREYAVSITSVAGLGDAKEDDVVNKPDDVESDSYMKALITVEPWVPVSVEGGI